MTKKTWPGRTIWVHGRPYPDPGDEKNSRSAPQKRTVPLAAAKRRGPSKNGRKV